MFNEHKHTNLNAETHEVIRARMYQAWKLIDASDAILTVFTCGGAVYYQAMSADTFEQYTILDTASRGAGYALRMRIDKRQAAKLVNNGAVLMCSVKYFNEYKNAHVNPKTGKPYNDGEVVEMMLYQAQGMEWHKDNKASDMGGDIVIDGIDYQVKASIRKGATLANEKRLHNAGVWAC